MNVMIRETMITAMRYSAFHLMLFVEKKGNDASIHSSAVPLHSGVSAEQSSKDLKKGDPGEAVIGVLSPANWEVKRPSKTVGTRKVS